MCITFIYICMYVCYMYVCMHVCMYVYTCESYEYVNACVIYTVHVSIPFHGTKQQQSLQGGSESQSPPGFLPRGVMLCHHCHKATM